MAANCYIYHMFRLISSLVYACVCCTVAYRVYGRFGHKAAQLRDRVRYGWMRKSSCRLLFTVRYADSGQSEASEQLWLTEAREFRTMSNVCTRRSDTNDIVKAMRAAVEGEAGLVDRMGRLHVLAQVYEMDSTARYGRLAGPCPYTGEIREVVNRVYGLFMSLPTTICHTSRISL